MQRRVRSRAGLLQACQVLRCGPSNRPFAAGAKPSGRWTDSERTKQAFRGGCAKACFCEATSPGILQTAIHRNDDIGSSYRDGVMALPTGEGPILSAPSSRTAFCMLMRPRTA